MDSIDKGNWLSCRGDILFAAPHWRKAQYLNRIDPRITGKDEI